MATRFATATGVWSNTGIWDGGTLPTSADTVHPNGFTVTIDQDITVQSLNNNISPVTIPNIATPAMTSNTQPTGTVISSNNSGTAYYAFNQDGTNTTFWSSAVNNSGWLGYTFPIAKVIKRYIWKSYGQNNNPKNWNFEGSNDGFATAGVPLDIITNYVTAGAYTSVLLSNTTAYTSYRINCTVTFNSGVPLILAELEMTESTVASPVYGATSGGSFTVPSSLSGTRNIVQSGAGMILSTGTLMTIAATSGATVNFNVTSGGYIFNPQWITVSSSNAKGVSITGNCAVNFNSNIWGSTGSFFLDTTGGQIYIAAAATVTINGNVYAPFGQGNNGYTYQIHMPATTSNSAILNINGDILASNGSALVYPIYNLSTSTINVTGNLTSNVSVCIQATSAAINVTGNIGMTLGNSNFAISSGSSTLTMNGSITNKGNKMAVYIPYIRFVSTATPYWIFQTNAGTDMTLSYGTATGPYPAEADVKLGVTYAASPTRTGTCAVPLPQYVSQGVATGSTVGTAYLNAADVWNIQTSTLTTSGSIGERLKTASTVQTNGDQLASYIV
jgi:hypothetical protein